MKGSLRRRRRRGRGGGGGGAGAGERECGKNGRKINNDGAIGGREREGCRGSFRYSKARCPGLRHRGERGKNKGLCILLVHAVHKTCAASYA